MPANAGIQGHRARRLEEGRLSAAWLMDPRFRVAFAGMTMPDRPSLNCAPPRLAQALRRSRRATIGERGGSAGLVLQPTAARVVPPRLRLPPGLPAYKAGELFDRRDVGTEGLHEIRAVRNGRANVEPRCCFVTTGLAH